MSYRTPTGLTSTSSVASTTPASPRTTSPAPPRTASRSSTMPPPPPAPSTNPFPPPARQRFEEFLSISDFAKHFYTAPHIDAYIAVVEQTPGYITKYNKRQKDWIRNKYTVIDGVLFRNVFPDAPSQGLRMVVRKEDIFDLVAADHIRIGHKGVVETGTEVWAKYYGIGVGEVRSVVELCQVCKGTEVERKDRGVKKEGEEERPEHEEKKSGKQNTEGYEGTSEEDSRGNYEERPDECGSFGNKEE